MYEKSISVRLPFTFGTMRVVLDQKSPTDLTDAEALQYGIEGDVVLGALANAAYQAVELVSQFVITSRAPEGLEITEGASWLDIKERYIRARVALLVKRAVPLFVLTRAVDMTLQNFRNDVTVVMDASYARYKTEQDAREAFAAVADTIGDPVAALFLGNMFRGDGFSRG